MFGKRLEEKGSFLAFFLCVCLDYIYSPFLCLTSESMLLSSATATKQIHFITKLKKKKNTKYGTVLTMVKIVCTVYQDRRRDKMRWTAGGNEKEKPEERGILWLGGKMTPVRLETMRENTRYPLPPNLTKQDCCWPTAAAATGGAPLHTIIGFHYAAISLK